MVFLRFAYFNKILYHANLPMATGDFQDGRRGGRFDLQKRMGLLIMMERH
jgi:hypothetical protein